MSVYKQMHNAKWRSDAIYQANYDKIFNKKNMFSGKFSLNSIDFKKLGTGFLIALLGAVATYLQDTIPGIDFGQYTLIVGALNSLLVNLIRKFITETTY